MISPLRKRHRLMFSVLTPLVLAVFFLALSNRAPVPTIDGLPDTLKASTFLTDSGLGEETLLDRVDFFRDPPTAARLVRSGAVLALELEPQEAVRQPHVLVYWRPEGGGDGVDEAHLLGQLLDGGAQTFSLPVGASGGAVVLYSLAHQQVLTHSNLPSVEWPAEDSPSESRELNDLSEPRELNDLSEPREEAEGKVFGAEGAES